MRALRGRAYWLVLPAAVFLLAACDRTPVGPAPPAIVTDIPPAPTQAALVTAATTATEEVVEARVVPATPTTPVAETTVAPTDEAPPTLLPLPSATLPPAGPDDSSRFAPGQQDMVALDENGFKPYLATGRRFEPLVLFVEPDSALDVELLALAGDVGETADLDSQNALTSANHAPEGDPEVLVLSPEANGDYSLIVRAVTGQGGYTAWLYDLVSPAPGMAVQQADTLAAGETKQYSVTSNGARPVIALVDPTDLSEVTLEIVDSNGVTLASADFSGPGGVETAFVLPRGEATYTVVVSEKTGGPSAYNVAIITLE